MSEPDAGYGLELVARSGARLVGLDLPPAAIDQARTNAERLGLAGRADLRVGDMTATGLDPASVSAVLCVDAAQFPPDFGATFVEAHGVLAPGGPAVFTGWRSRDPQDPVVQERIRQVDLAAGLTAAGFVDVRARSREDWLAEERDAWRPSWPCRRPTTRPCSRCRPRAVGCSSAGTRSAGCWRPADAGA